MTTLPARLDAGRSSFNWTWDVVQARTSAQDIAEAIPDAVGVNVIELEAGQVFRSFPAPAPREVDALRAAVAAGGGRVSIVGASIDDFVSSSERRTENARLAFLEPQMRAVRRVGAWGFRLPFGQTGRSLLKRLQPLLHELDLTLYEEIQVSTASPTPASTPSASSRTTASDSLSIPACSCPPCRRPTSTTASGGDIHRPGRPAGESGSTRNAYRGAGTLRSGVVPPPVHTLYMNLSSASVRSEVADLQDVMDLVGGFHLKFWDLDDSDCTRDRPTSWVPCWATPVFGGRSPVSGVDTSGWTRTPRRRRASISRWRVGRWPTGLRSAEGDQVRTTSRSTCTRLPT